ncbi:hypothetical protein KIL84_022214 [Mauremys mutica]|uniref:Uncharacterized protein n=1 Tax=Mauremys mutica TaxID=74926 RepID=A0A9D3X5E6_9SAUR|nr:hypothetical protein KIL84_022214 [Mauremys mutica]
MPGCWMRCREDAPVFVDSAWMQEGQVWAAGGATLGEASPESPCPSLAAPAPSPPAAGGGPGQPRRAWPRSPSSCGKSLPLRPKQRRYAPYRFRGGLFDSASGAQQ